MEEPKTPEITATISTCAIHGAVDGTHRCPDFDHVLRDAWTGKLLHDDPDGPADNVRYLGMTEDGTQFTP